MKCKHYASIALIMTLCMLAVAVMSPLLVSDEDVQERDVQLAGIFDGDVDFVDVALMLISPIFGLLWNLAEYIDDAQTGDSTPESIADQLRAHESELVYTILAKNVELLENSINGYSDIWKFTNNYWMRQAEIAAAERWANTTSYYAPYIMERSGLIENLCRLFENIEEGPDKTFELMNDRLAVWSADSNYSQMSIVLSYGSITLSNSSNMDLHLRSMINVTSSSASVAYLDGRELWVSNGNAKITAEDGTTYNLASGYNNLAALGIPSGLYAFQTGHQYAGSIVPITAANAATVYTGLVISAGNDLKIGQYYNNQILIDSTNHTDLSVHINTGDGTTSKKIDVMNMLRIHGLLIDAAYESLTKTHVAAQAAWKIYDAAQAANILLSPSSLVPNIDRTYTSEELYTLTVLYLAQVSDYYERTNGNLQKTGFNLSSDSLNLYLRGSIYDQNGLLLYDSAVFTPYLWLNSMTIVQGTNTFDQAGCLAVWGTASTLNGWSGVDGKAPQLVTIQPGYSIEVAQVMYDGALRSSYTLNIHEIEKWDEVTVVPAPAPVPVPDVVDLAVYIMVILLLVAVCLFELWIILDGEIIWILLAAVVCVLLAVFASDWIAGLL